MRYAGVTGVVELTPVREYDPRSGVSRVRRFKGPRELMGPETVPGTIESDLKNLGIKYREEETDPGWLIVAAQYSLEENQNLEEPLTDVWELDGGRVESVLWMLPKVARIMDYIQPEEDKAFARQAFDALLRGERTATNSAGVNIAIDLKSLLVAISTAVRANGGDGSAAATTMRAYYGERIKGVDSFPLDTYVLQRTRTIALKAPRSPWADASANVNKLYTAASLSAIEGFDASSVPFTLPRDENGGEGYYLKGSPTYKLLGPDRWKITQSYEWFEYYSVFTYGDAL